MLPRLLAWVLVQAIGMAIAHVVLARRSDFPRVLFCGISAAIMTVAGLATMGDLLVEHVRLSAWTAAWIPAFALGAFSAGIVVGLLWLVIVQGGGWWLRRKLTR